MGTVWSEIFLFFSVSIISAVSLLLTNGTVWPVTVNLFLKRMRSNSIKVQSDCCSAFCRNFLSTIGTAFSSILAVYTISTIIALWFWCVFWSGLIGLIFWPNAPRFEYFVFFLVFREIKLEDFVIIFFNRNFKWDYLFL